MKTLSEIEKRLLDAELKLIQEAFVGCMNQLKIVLDKVPSGGPAVIAEINEWLHDSCKLDQTYSPGRWVLNAQIPSTSNLPESFKAALLKNATDKFFERIEGIEEIVQDLEDRS